MPAEAAAGMKQKIVKFPQGSMTVILRQSLAGLVTLRQLGDRRPYSRRCSSCSSATPSRWRGWRAGR
jgi:hypothetical protein